MIAVHRTHTLAKPRDLSDERIVEELQKQFGVGKMTTGPMFRAAFALGASDKLLERLGGSYLLVEPSFMSPKASELPYVEDLRSFKVPDAAIAQFVANVCCDPQYGELHSEGFWAKDELLDMFTSKELLYVLFCNMIHGDPVSHYTEERVGIIESRLAALGMSDAQISDWSIRFQVLASKELNCFGSRFQAEAMVQADMQRAAQVADFMQAMKGWNVFALGMRLASHARHRYFAEAKPLAAALKARPGIAPLLFGALEAGHKAMNDYVLGDMDRSVFPAMIDSLAEIEGVRELFESCGHSILPVTRNAAGELSVDLRVGDRSYEFLPAADLNEGDYVIVAHLLVELLRPDSVGSHPTFRANLPRAVAADDQAISQLI